MTDGYPNINGCKYCDQPKLDHAGRWHKDIGWHGWQTPTDAQRKARWKEHMNAREARKRQQVIEITLCGMEEMLIHNTSLLQELNPEQEHRFEKLVKIAMRKLEIEP